MPPDEAGARDEYVLEQDKQRREDSRASLERVDHDIALLDRARGRAEAGIEHLAVDPARLEFAAVPLFGRRRRLGVALVHLDRIAGPLSFDDGDGRDTGSLDGLRDWLADVDHVRKLESVQEQGGVDEGETA